MEELAKKYCFLRSLEYSLPRDPKEVTESKPGLFFVFVDALEHGLRLPLPTFAIAILRHYQIHHSMLQAQSWGFIIGFLVRCLETGVTATVGLLREFHSVNASPGKRGFYFKSRVSQAKKLLVEPTKSVKGWRGRYFIVRNLLGFTPCPWCNSLDTQRLNQRKTLSEAEKIDLVKLSALAPEEVNSVVWEDRLRQVRLSMSSSQQARLDEEEEVYTGTERGGVQDTRDEPMSSVVIEGESRIKPSSGYNVFVFYFKLSFLTYF
ncbi:hypothetical protein CFOL_v3_32552 [Cephalotus follicularis]|uniref:Transposase (putative) gypsy type domain-containing protein n=1 Tax=Cephalotus follicularis TaxID=3775 RepID=A0A1Q3D9Z4_CEPFO|nr:hypothetical protein CFOL_v3_32552 [Cephalotus follicularis]